MKYTDEKDSEYEFEYEYEGFEEDVLKDEMEDKDIDNI